MGECGRDEQEWTTEHKYSGLTTRTRPRRSTGRTHSPRSQRSTAYLPGRPPEDTRSPSPQHEDIRARHTNTRDNKDDAHLGRILASRTAHTISSSESTRAARWTHVYVARLVSRMCLPGRPCAATGVLGLRVPIELARIWGQYGAVSGSLDARRCRERQTLTRLVAVHGPTPRHRRK